MPSDLHLHTTTSDGTDDLSTRVQQAKSEGLDNIAATDHESINSGLEESEQEMDGVNVITGAEIKCRVSAEEAGLETDESIEVLTYFLDPQDQRSHDLVNEAKELMEQEIKSRIDAVNENIPDADIGYDEVWEMHGGGIPNRYHLSKVMAEQEVGALEKDEYGRSEAFNLYIGRSELIGTGDVDESDAIDCYVPNSKIEADEVISRAHDIGAVVSLAHPGRKLGDENLDPVVEYLSDQGLDAIEGPYPYSEKESGGDYNISFSEQRARECAEEYDLLLTGGSDCHGEGSGKNHIGEVWLDNKHVKKLREIAPNASI